MIRDINRETHAVWNREAPRTPARPPAATKSPLAKNAKSAKGNRATIPSDLGALCVPFDAAQGSALRETQCLFCKRLAASPSQDLRDKTRLQQLAVRRAWPGGPGYGPDCQNSLIPPRPSADKTDRDCDRHLGWRQRAEDSETSVPSEEFRHDRGVMWRGRNEWDGISSPR